MKVKELAALANVSLSTISKVLTNQSDVSEATRNKVLAIMDEVDFRPSRIKTEHKMIAYVCNDPSAIESSFGSHLLSGMYSVSSMSNFQLMLLPYQKEFRSRVYLKHVLRSYGISGIICNLRESDDDFYQTLVKADIPHVIFNYYDNRFGASTMNIDNAGGGYSAAKFLIDNGHRRIGIVTRPGFHDDNERMAGCMRRLEEEGVTAAWIFQDKPSNDEGELQTFLLQSDDATAIFSTNYLSSFKLLRATRSIHREIPRDVSLISFGDYEFTTFLQPALTALRIPVRQMGIQAANELIASIKGTYDSRRQIVIGTELIVRESVKSVRP